MVKSAVDFGQVASDLEHLAELLESGWCQGAYARDEEGKVLVSQYDLRAVSFCLVGGLLRTLGDPSSISMSVARKALGDTLGGMHEGALTGWNDHKDRTKEHVVCLCLDTAKRLRSSTPLRS